MLFGVCTLGMCLCWWCGFDLVEITWVLMVHSYWQISLLRLKCLHFTKSRTPTRVLAVHNYGCYTSWMAMRAAPWDATSFFVFLPLSLYRDNRITYRFWGKLSKMVLQGRKWSSNTFAFNSSPLYCLLFNWLWTCWCASSVVCGRRQAAQMSLGGK